MEKSEHISTKAMRSSKLLAILVLTTILVLSIVFIYTSIKPSPTTWDVYPGQSIQAVLDSASPGDTMVVHEGEYHQSVVITKSISLIGEGAILDGTSPADPSTTLDDDGIIIDEGVSGVTINGFEIRNCSYYGIQAWNNGTSNIEIINNVIHDNGIAISVGNDGTGFHENWFIHNNTVYKNEIGIYVAQGKNVVISNNIANESFWSGIWIGIEPDSTLNSEHIEVINNTVTNSYLSGIYVINPSKEAELENITITGNTVSDCGADGIVVLKLSEDCRNSTDVFISDNRVHNNGGAGILLEGVSYGKVWANKATNNFRDGIIVFDSNHIIVKRNLVTNNVLVGIGINSADNNKVIDNIVKDNRWGIVLVDGSSYNIVMFNEAKGNIVYDLSDDKTGTDNIWEFNIYDTKDW